MRSAPLFFAGAMFAASGPANAQHLGGGGGPDVSVIRIIAAFVLCAAAAVVLALIVRRRAAGGRKGAVRLALTRLFPAGLKGARRIEVMEARRISLHADLCLIRCDGTEYLLLCGASGHEILARQVLPCSPDSDNDA